MSAKDDVFVFVFVSTVFVTLVCIGRVIAFFTWLLGYPSLRRLSPLFVTYQA